MPLGPKTISEAILHRIINYKVPAEQACQHDSHIRDTSSGWWCHLEEDGITSPGMAIGIGSSDSMQ